MGKIIYFELRKTIFRKYYVCMFFLLVLINFVNIYLTYRTHNVKYEEIVNRNFVSDKKWDSNQELHKKLDGKLNKEKVKYTIDTYTKLSNQIEDRTYSTKFDENTFTGYIFGDYTFFTRQFYEPIKYIAEYSGTMNEKLQLAQENAVYYKKHHNTYEYEKNRYILNHYSNRHLNTFYETKVWAKLLEYNFSDFLLIILMLLGVVPMYNNEKSVGMYHLIASTKKGKYDLCIGKYIAAILPTLFLVLLFSVQNYFMFFFTFGLSSGKIPLYTIQQFQYTPLNCTIFQFYLITLLMKCLGFIVLGVFFCLISERTSSLIVCYVISVVLTVLLVFFSGYVNAVEDRNIILGLLSPMTLLKGVDLYQQLEGISIFHRFVPRGTASVCIHLCFVTVVFGIRLIERRKKDEI